MNAVMILRMRISCIGASESPQASFFEALKNGLLEVLGRDVLLEIMRLQRLVGTLLARLRTNKLALSL